MNPHIAWFSVPWDRLSVCQTVLRFRPVLTSLVPRDHGCTRQVPDGRQRPAPLTAVCLRKHCLEVAGHELDYVVEDLEHPAAGIIQGILDEVAVFQSPSQRGVRLRGSLAR